MISARVIIRRTTEDFRSDSPFLKTVALPSQNLFDSESKKCRVPLALSKK